MFFNANFKGTKCLLGKGIHSAKSIYSHEEEIHERSNGRNTSNTGRSLSGTVQYHPNYHEHKAQRIYGFKIEVIFV